VQHELTFEGQLTPEVDMMFDALVSSSSTAGRAEYSPPAFVRSWTNGDPEAAWVHVAGDLNVATVSQLVRKLREPRLQLRLVVLDLRDLVQIDSSGLQAIVKACVRAREVGRRLVLLRGPPNVDRVFTRAGSSDDLEIGDIHPLESPAQVLRDLLEAGVPA
jgi:anti-anti-sigma factor